MNTMIRIASVKPLEDPALYQSALEAASPERRQKVRSLGQAADRARSLGAELLLRKLMQDCGHSSASLRYVYGPYGKPCLSGLDGFFFNLSHSGDYVMAAAAGREIGCDIERVGQYEEKVARRFFTPEEMTELEALRDPEERRERFFRLWTLKESYLKATGRGLSLPLSAFRIVIGPDDTVSPLQYEDGKTYHFAEPIPVPGYRCAVCAAGPLDMTECKVEELREILFQRTGGPLSG